MGLVRRFGYLLLCLLAWPAFSADLPPDKPVADVQYAAADPFYAGASANFLAGVLSRQGSNFFKIWNFNGTNNFQLLDNGYEAFSNRAGFIGVEGETFIGWRNGDRALELFAGGGGIWSDSSSSTPKFDTLFQHNGLLFTVVSPTPNAAGSGNTSYQWYSTNRFDIGNVQYSDHFERNDFFVGLRPTFFLGPGPVSLKDGTADATYDPAKVYKFQPMIFFAGGRMSVNQHFSGQTDGDAGLQELNITFRYDNKIVSDFYGAGLGISASVPVFSLGSIPVGLVGNFKGSLEFQNASGTSAWSYNQYLFYSAALNAYNANLGIAGCQGGPPVGNCNNFIANVGSAKTALVSTSSYDTTFSLATELGLSFGILPDIDLNIGARYRRYDVPEMVLDGVHNAHIEFHAADEIGGFVGLKAKF